MQVTQEQFKKQLDDRLRMLVRSAEAYDQGDYAEAIRLASSIVKIIGDRKDAKGIEKKNFISLSTRLGKKPLEMLETSLPEAIDQAHLHGPLFILGFHIADATGLIPILDGFQEHSQDACRFTPFDKWWNDPIIRDGLGNGYSRKEIIETMRDKEDAHSDDQLAPEYASVAYKGALGITQINSNDHKFDINPARVVARQVAHEVLRTFMPDLPPKWIQTRGFKVQPIYLFEIHEQGEDGEYHLVTDHKAAEFKSETTSSPEVWREWEKFIGNRVPNEEPHKAVTTKQQRMRLGIFNYAPYPEQIRAMISIHDPAD